MEGFIDTSSSFPFFEETDFSWFASDDFVFADHVPESPLAEEFLELNTLEFVQPVAQIVEQALVEAPQNVVVSSDLVVTVLQKRRGNGGLWQPLTQDERIRVDKIKGKLVKLIVKSNRQNLSEKDWDVQIFLVDKAHPEQPIHPGDGFTIEQPTRPTKGGMDANCREFKLKLTKISKSQYFYVSASKPGVSLCGYSLEFRSDDNGKVLSSKKRSRHEMETAIVPTAFPPTNTLICKDICADNGLVNMIARSLVPILLDNFQNQLNTGNLEDNIAKRIKLAFAPQIKTEPVSC